MQSIFTNVLRRFFTSQWFIMFDLAGRDPKYFSEFRRIMPPKDRFWADPFLIRKEGKYYIYFEELIYNKQKGHISLIVMNEDGTCGVPTRVLERPYHISYPFVFEWKGDYYMVPETHFNKTIELYKCRSFPEDWAFHSTLMRGVSASDSTLFWYNNRWWLFADIPFKSAIGNNKKLHARFSHHLSLFYSDNLFSQTWVAHPSNPIVMDQSRARPAGKIFQKDGKIVRPSQDCSTRYGNGIRLNEIVTLSETEYEEKEIQSIVPDTGDELVAVHTYNRDCSLTVMDGAQLIFAPRLYRIPNRLRRFLQLDKN